MAEPALKLAPKPVELPATEVPAAEAPQPAARRQRRPLRFILLVALPLLALVGGLSVYLAGGRYISTDNAYVGSQKVLITPDISGKISAVTVTEGEHVKAGQALFSIDPVPFRLALEQAEARVANVRTDVANVKVNLATTERLIVLAQQTVKLKQNDVDRKTALLSRNAGSQIDADSSLAQLVTARTQVEQLTQQRNVLQNQLLGDPDLAIEKYPAFMQASAALDQARRDLAHAVVRAPINGTATQVPSIQLGRYITAGTPIFALVDDDHPWVDANPKETDVTYLRIGQPVSLKVDAFPDDTFAGIVEAVSPGTGAQFAILPPQNATGNWVKVVQRLPIRIALTPGQDVQKLRAGMSVNVDVDTGRKRTFAGLFGFAQTADAAQNRPAAAPK